MRNVGRWINNVLILCGSLVDKAVNKLGINKRAFAQYPQTIFSVVLNAKLATFLYSSYEQFLHTNFTQYSSVSNGFYALSTGPTITTTLINYKKGL